MLLIVGYRASVTGLIQLYVVGIFLSFTLSQVGMVRHWLRVRGDGWVWSVALNGTGAVVTGVVLVVVTVTRFAGGAWLVVLAIPLLVLLMRGVRRHYAAVSLALRTNVAEVAPPKELHTLLLIDRVDEAAARALSYALSARPASLAALAVPIRGEDVAARWAQLAPHVPLEVLQPADSRGVVAAVAAAARDRAADNGTDTFTNAIVVETLSRTWLDQVTEHRLALRIKQRLTSDGAVVVTDVTSPIGGPGPYAVEQPAEHHVVVLVNAVNAASKRALQYAQTLHATSVRALSINIDSDVSNRLLDEWLDWDMAVPLELIDSPFRSLTRSMRRYLREFNPDGRHTVVTCVLPEATVSRWYHQPLHNQSALQLKGALLFERGVVTTSVPYALGRLLDDEAKAERLRQG